MEFESPRTRDGFLRWSVEAAIRIGVLAVIVLWSIWIVTPFVHIVMWAIIMAVAVYPLHARWAAWLGGRTKLAAALLALLAILMLLVPAGLFFGTALQEGRGIARQAEAGTLEFPPPPDGVRDWPLIGERVHAAWDAATTQFGANLDKFRPELAALGKRALSALKGLSATVLQLLLSILVAAVLLTNQERGGRVSVKFARRLAGERGEELVGLSVGTIRSVFLGVLGIALIQSALAAIGMAAIGVPGALLWALIVLILAVMQIPPLLVLGPVMIWAFATQSTWAAVIFLVYGMIVSISDTFLKPLFLGRGLDVPMLVILLGAIGGMVHSGIIGLFVGAVVLAVSYQLLMAWLENGTDRGRNDRPSAEGRQSDGA